MGGGAIGVEVLGPHHVAPSQGSICQPQGGLDDDDDHPEDRSIGVRVHGAKLGQAIGTSPRDKAEEKVGEGKARLGSLESERKQRVRLGKTPVAAVEDRQGHGGQQHQVKNGLQQPPMWRLGAHHDDGCGDQVDHARERGDLEGDVEAPDKSCEGGRQLVEVKVYQPQNRGVVEVHPVDLRMVGRARTCGSEAVEGFPKCLAHAAAHVRSNGGSRGDCQVSRQRHQP
mmetsp:Transcript_50169/g.160582  ORF Transcript_50169/g.160582 Transcript_50169/m.160582 type:complete len:227 (+) Transcript_50169:192-872(+)